MKRLICIILALMLVLTGCGDVAKSESIKISAFDKAHRQGEKISTDWEYEYDKLVAEYYEKGQLIEPVQHRDSLWYETWRGKIKYVYMSYSTSKQIAAIDLNADSIDIVASTKEEFISKFKELNDLYTKCLILENVGYKCAITIDGDKATYDDNIIIEIEHLSDYRLDDTIEYTISFKGTDAIYYGTIAFSTGYLTYDELAEAYFTNRGIDINPPEVIGSVSKNDDAAEEPAVVEEEIANSAEEQSDGVIDTPPDEDIPLENVYHDNSYDIDYYYDGTTLEVYHELMGYSGTENLYAMQNLPIDYYNHSTDAYGRDLIYTSQDAYAVQSMIDGYISEIVWAIDPCGYLCEKVSVSNADGTIEYYVYALDCKYNVGYDLSKGDIFAAAGIIEFQYYSFNGNYTAQTILEEFYK